MAYYVSPDLKPITFSEISEPDEGKIPEEINAVEHTPNKLRVSQINNPFVFPQEFTYILSGGDYRLSGCYGSLVTRSVWRVSVICVYDRRYMGFAAGE